MTTTRHTDGVTETPAIQPQPASTKKKVMRVVWIALVVLIVVAGWFTTSLINALDPANTGSRSIFEPADRAPLTGNSGNAPVAPAPVPAAQKPFVASVADANVPLIQRLKTADALPEFPPIKGTATDRIDKILGGFNAAWSASCGHGGKATPNPHYLWGFMQEMKSFWYVQYGQQSPALCGIVSLTNEPTVVSDPQAAAGSTSRWYDLSLSFTNGGNPKSWGPVLVRLEGTHWLIVGAPAFMEGSSFAHTATGQSIQDDPAKIVARLEGMRQQAFIQKSEGLLRLYYPGEMSDNPVENQEVADLKAGKVPTGFTSTLLKSTGPAHPGTITVEATEQRGGKTISRSLMYNWFSSPDPGGYTSLWANSH